MFSTSLDNPVKIKTAQPTPTSEVNESLNTTPTKPFYKDQIQDKYLELTSEVDDLLIRLRALKSQETDESTPSS